MELPNPVSLWISFVILNQREKYFGGPIFGDILGVNDDTVQRGSHAREHICEVQDILNLPVILVRSLRKKYNFTEIYDALEETTAATAVLPRMY